MSLMEKPATPLYQNGGSPVRTSVLGKEEGDCGCGAFPALTQTGEAKRSRLLLTQRRWRDSLACFAGKSVRENAALCCAKHRGIRQCAHCRMNMPPACSIHIRISPLSKITQPPRWGGCVIFGGDGEIRTLEELLTPTRFPIVRARPTTRHLRIAQELSACIL